MNAIEFDIYLEQPIIISQAISGGENTTLSMDYIPGSIIRGALIANYLKKGHRLTFSGDDNLFFDNNVSFLNAYPKFEGKRTIPTPLSWRVNKDALNDDSFSIIDYSKDGHVDLPRPVTSPGNFFYPTNFDQNGKDVVLIDPKKEQNIHIGSTEKMVVESGKNFVFTYEALIASQTFRAVIISENTTLDPEKLGVEDNKLLTIGRSKAANYGLCRIKNIKTIGGWQECLPLKPAEIEETDKIFILTLLSPAIFIDKDGQPSLYPDWWLDRGELEDSFVKPILVGGFNRKWKMPVPQVIAAAAGSTYKYRKSAIKTELPNSLGERTKEGFGRYAINLFSEKTWSRTQNTPKNILVLPNITSKKKISKEAIDAIKKRNLDIAIESALRSIRIEKSPNNSQLSRLREAAVSARVKESLGPIKMLLENLKDNAKDQFLTATIELNSGENPKFLHWIKNLAEKPKEAIGFPKDKNYEYTNKDEVYYVARLIEKFAKLATLAQQSDKETKHD